MFEQGATSWALKQPVRNRAGYSLLGFVLPSGVQPEQHRPVTASLVAVRCGGRYLVGYNRGRRRWELPAGGIERGESTIACALRELREEAGQSPERLRACGLAHAARASGYRKYTALFHTDMATLAPFRANDEWSRIDLWDLRERAQDFDPLDRLVLQYCERVVALADAAAPERGR